LNHLSAKLPSFPKKMLTMKIEEQYNRAKDRLNGRLFAPYQREGVLWMLTMENQTSGPKGGFLCDEMGLGKTVQMVSTMLGNIKRRTLVVVPKSIITQWVNEIKKFAPQLSVHVFDGPKRHLKEADIVIMPYSLLSTPEETTIHRHTWDRVILDEAHEIRNKSSRLFKSVCRLKTDIKWIVTGTPVFNSMKDWNSPRVTLRMWNLICFQMRGSCMSLSSRMLRIQSRMLSSMPSVSTRVY